MSFRKITKAEAQKVDENLRHTHPNAILKELVDLITRIGASKFLHGAGLNKERDAFVACMFSFAIRAHVGAECYIQQINDPPDFALLIPTKRPTKEKPFDFAQVEIVEITQAVDKEEDKLGYVVKILMSTKLTNYAPEKGTILLIFLNTSNSLVIQPLLIKWYEENKKLFDNFGEVFTIHINSSDEKVGLVYTVTSVTREWKVTQTLNKEVSNKGIPDKLIEKYGVIVEQ
jgi:hypothetical protein